MGYFFVGIILVVLLGLSFSFMSRANRKPSGRADTDDEPMNTAQPAAEEVTPGASVTASPAQAEKARRHTPPA